MSTRLGTLLAISLALHLLALLLLTSPAFHHFLQQLQPVSAPPPPPPSLTMLKLQKAPPPPPKTQYVPTLPSQETPLTNPNAILESERNTALQSKEPARDPNSPLPALAGDKRAAFNYQNTPASPEVKSTPSLPSPQAQAAPPQPPQPKPPTPVTPPTPPAPKAEAAAAKQVPVLPPADLNSYPLFPPPPTTKTPAEKDKEGKPKAQPDPQPAQPPQPQQPPPPAPPQDPSKASPAAPPPSPASFSQSRSDINGSSARFGDPSPEAKQTEIGKYKAKLYRMIGSRWYHSVDANMIDLRTGSVHIKFFVQANGVIDSRRVEILETSGDVGVLQTISLGAVNSPDNQMEPFSDNMKQQLGDGYWEDITFTIY